MRTLTIDGGEFHIDGEPIGPAIECLFLTRRAVDRGGEFGPEFLVWTKGELCTLFAPSLRQHAKRYYRYLALTAADLEARQLTGVRPHGPIPCRLYADGRIEPARFDVPNVASVQNAAERISADWQRKPVCAAW